MKNGCILFQYTNKALVLQQLFSQGSYQVSKEIMHNCLQGIVISARSIVIYWARNGVCQWQGWLNSLKVVGAQLTNKTHFYSEKLKSYEHLQILWGQVPPVPPWFCRLWSEEHKSLQEFPNSLYE